MQRERTNKKQKTGRMCGLADGLTASGYLNGAAVDFAGRWEEHGGALAALRMNQWTFGWREGDGLKNNEPGLASQTSNWSPPRSPPGGSLPPAPCSPDREPALAHDSGGQFSVCPANNETSPIPFPTCQTLLDSDSLPFDVAVPRGRGDVLGWLKCTRPLSSRYGCSPR